MIHHTLQIGNADTYSCICETSGNNYKHVAGVEGLHPPSDFLAQQSFSLVLHIKKSIYYIVIEFKNDAQCLNGYNIFFNVYSLHMNNGNKNINNEMVLLLIHKVPVSFIGVEIAYRIPSLYFYKCSNAHSCFHLSGTAKQEFINEIFIVLILQRMRYIGKNNKPV